MTESRQGAASTRAHHVIVSGAGPVGLTLAIEPARRDVDFVLIDKAPHPFAGSRGKGIQPRTLEVFEDLGVLDRMVAGVRAQQLDLGDPLSPLTDPGDLAGYRAPGAPLTGAGGQPVRLFHLLAGPWWTLIGHEVQDVPAPRAGLRVHATGVRGEIVDSGGHLRDAYALSSGDWVLIRPDGYVAMVTTDLTVVESYLNQAGLHRPQR